MILSLTTAPIGADGREFNFEHCPDEEIIFVTSFFAIIGDLFARHDIYIGIDADDFGVFWPMLAVFDGRLYGITSDFAEVNLRFQGTLDEVEWSAFTDMVMTLSGEPVGFEITLTEKVRQERDEQSIVSDINLIVLREPGYGGVHVFRGKYRGLPFTLYLDVEFGLFDNTPADADDLQHLSVTFLPEDGTLENPVNDVTFYFTGVHQALNLYDLQDVRLTKGGVDVPFQIHLHTTRNTRINICEDGIETIVTAFTAVFRDSLTDPGTYQLTGRYRGEPFQIRWTQK